MPRIEIPLLLKRRIVIPHFSARTATAGLEQDGDRATWRFGPGEKKPTPFEIKRVRLDDGKIVYRNANDNTALDARAEPVRGEADMDVQGLSLARVFSASQEMQESFGTLYGRAKLSGRGASVGDLLGTSNGQLSLAIDGGQMSLLLVELLGLDVAEAGTLLGSRRSLTCGTIERAPEAQWRHGRRTVLACAPGSA